LETYLKLFAKDDIPLAQRRAMLAEERSVLDSVMIEAKDMQRGLTKSDTDKLHEYFQSIRDIETRLGSRVLAIDAGDHAVIRLAWCTGAAQGFIAAAAERGVDAFVSGEVSEPTFHLAREMGIHYIAAGHHATERYGVQALATEIASRFGIRQQFIDIPNPV